MGILSKIFTWWDGATIGTSLFSALNGEHVGTDAAGNKYYRGGKTVDGRERRWVIYNGANDASRVPAEWHGWLHGSFDDLPESNLPPPRRSRGSGPRGSSCPARPPACPRKDRRARRWRCSRAACRSSRSATASRS